MGATSLNRQQHASARHYLKRPVTKTALQTVLSLTATHFQFPMVQVNVVDADYQYTIGSFGTDLGKVPRAHSFCDQVVREGKPMIFDGFSARHESLDYIHFYIGVPITGREGLVIGTLCLFDTTEHEFDESQLQQLQAVACVIEDQLELMRRLENAPAGSPTEAAELSRAIQLGQIVPLYQPILNLATGKVRAVEALARWQHPTRGLLPPSEFIPLAEDSEIIIELDVAILTRAAVDVARWQDYVPGLRLNANLSARHFDHPDCVGRLSGAVVKAGLSPEFVTFEITETTALAARPDGKDFLTALRDRGFRVVLDDFGTGFSSIEQVLRLPVDGIKVDRSVTSALGSKVGDAVVRALIGLTSDLQMTAVIEGIETADQAARAAQLGCTLGQGYLWSKPLNSSSMSACLAQGT